MKLGRIQNPPLATACRFKSGLRYQFKQLNLLVIYIFAISTLLNVYYLLEIPAKAFFQPKRTNIQVTKHPLIVYPTFFAAMLTIVLFIYIEPLKDITNLISGNQ